MLETSRNLSKKNKKKKAYKTNKIIHNHTCLNKGKIIRKRTLNKDYSIQLWSNHKNEIEEFIEYIKKNIKEEKEIIVKEYPVLYNPEKQEVIYSYDHRYYSLIGDSRGVECDGYYKRKITEIKTYTYPIKEKYTAYCTDWEHYDAETDTDIRDGGIVMCKPHLGSIGYNNDCDCGCKESLVLYKKNKNNYDDNYSCNDYRDFYNSGYNLIEL